MPDEFRPPDDQQPLELTTDFLGEDRHEFVAKLAYKLWAQRGRRLGSPDIEWFAADVRAYTLCSASQGLAPSLQ